MKELKKLFTSFYQQSGINLCVKDSGQNVIFGSLLEKENNTYFDFLYKTEKMVCLIEGKTESSVLASKMLKAMLGYKESLVIKGKSDYALKTLLGIAGSKAQTEKYKINLTKCVVILIKSNGQSNLVYDFLPVYTQCIPIKIDKNLCALCLGKNEEDDYLSHSKFASVLASAIQEELGIKIKVGVGNSVGEFEEINTSYLQAKKALEMGEVFAEKQVYSYSEVLPIKMISFLNEKEKIEFLKPFKQILKNEELTTTAQEFLNSGLNVKKTAEKLFVHRNTLNYRLNKIEKQVGLDLRNFNDAVTFRMVCLMYKLKEGNE